MLTPEDRAILRDLPPDEWSASPSPPLLSIAIGPLSHAPPLVAVALLGLGGVVLLAAARGAR